MECTNDVNHFLTLRKNNNNLTTLIDSPDLIKNMSFPLHLPLEKNGQTSITVACLLFLYYLGLLCVCGVVVVQCPSNNGSDACVFFVVNEN